jgi:hypothetical protein
MVNALAGARFPSPVVQRMGYPNNRLDIPTMGGAAVGVNAE